MAQEGKIEASPELQEQIRAILSEEFEVERADRHTFTRQPRHGRCGGAGGAEVGNNPCGRGFSRSSHLLRFL